VEDRISRELQYCHKMCCEKGGCHKRWACIIWRCNFQMGGLAYNKSIFSKRKSHIREIYIDVKNNSGMCHWHLVI